ncbi:MAG: 50S ribosomal protein L29 [Rickettsiales bacterium]|jgi:ribosomal protein L29|nr:50S ribosomal protein L29 [Rickettsiales bacterium]
MAAKKEIKKAVKADKEVLSSEALKSRLVDLKKEAMENRFKLAAGQLPKTHVVRKNRREIARVLTALNNKKDA